MLEKCALITRCEEEIQLPYLCKSNYKKGDSGQGDNQFKPLRPPIINDLTRNCTYGTNISTGVRDQVKWFQEVAEICWVVHKTQPSSIILVSHPPWTSIS